MNYLTTCPHCRESLRTCSTLTYRLWRLRHRLGCWPLQRPLALGT